jgi:iron complex outermembrane receptor protein
VNLPLFANEDAGSRFDLTLAGRYSDYSTGISQFTPKYGMRWQVADELVFRASFAEGFRAPSIGELFGSASRFDAQLDDPCTTPLLNPSLAGNCAALGVPSNYVQPNPQISVTTGGNDQLDPEFADSFTAGFVWSPSFLEDSAIADRVDLEFTYYSHDIEGAIQAIDAQTQLDLCVQTLDPLYCSGISRASTGGINAFANRLSNLGSIKTNGWDVDLSWAFPMQDWGQVKMAWRNTFVGKYEAVGAAGQPQPQGPGREVVDSAIPDWTSNLVTEWANGPWSASWTFRHISELRESCGRVISFAVCSDPATDTNVLDATTYSDLQVGYQFDTLANLRVTFGANNVFDKDPPICVSCSLNGYDASTYDIPGGRFFYLRAEVSF